MQLYEKEEHDKILKQCKKLKFPSYLEYFCMNKRHRPRKILAYAKSPDLIYYYGKYTPEYHGYTPFITYVTEGVENALGIKFPCVLVQVYLDGEDCVYSH